MSRGASPWTRIGHLVPSTDRTSEAAFRSDAWLVNSTNIPPSEA